MGLNFFICKDLNFVTLTLHLYHLFYVRQVNLIHVPATCKNAADEKLKQAIRRFADIHGSPAAIILISSDINFAADLSDLRHRKKIYVILLHKKNTSEALILCANEHYDFMELTEPLPSRPPPKVWRLVCDDYNIDKGISIPLLLINYAILFSHVIYLINNIQSMHSILTLYFQIYFVFCVSVAYFVRPNAFMIQIYYI